MKGFAILLIRFYQRFLSFDTGVLRFLEGGVPTCRFTPHCSEYTIEAISHFGVIKGIALGGRRILKCHGGSKGGFDPVRIN